MSQTTTLHRLQVVVHQFKGIHLYIYQVQEEHEVYRHHRNQHPDHLLLIICSHIGGKINLHHSQLSLQILRHQVPHKDNINRNLAPRAHAGVCVLGHREIRAESLLLYVFRLFDRSADFRLVSWYLGYLQTDPARIALRRKSASRQQEKVEHTSRASSHSDCIPGL